MSLIEEGPEAKCEWPTWRSSARSATNVSQPSIPDCCARHGPRSRGDVSPERFNNKTNGVTPRRWLLIGKSGAVGRHQQRDWGWRITDFSEIAGLKCSPAMRPSAQKFLRAKRAAKSQFAHWLRSTSGQAVDPDSIFDCQVKRIHEYKRQMLNALRIIVLYNRIKAHPNLDMTPRTFFSRERQHPRIVTPKLIISSSTTSRVRSRATPWSATG